MGHDLSLRPFIYNLIISIDLVGLHIVEQSLWKAVPHYLRRVSSALKKVTYSDCHFFNLTSV
jgi:phosphoenolpyruvate carboxylase